MLRSATTLAFAALLPLAACATTPIERPAPEAVVMTFGWKPGMRMKVQEERTDRFQAPGQRSFERRIQHGKQMEIVAFPQGMVVGTHEVSTSGEGLDPTTLLLAELEEDFQRVVAPNGELLGFTNVATLPQRIDERLDADPSFVALPQPSRDEYRATLKELAHPALLQQNSARDWMASVGQWVGKTLELGRKEVGEGREYRAIERIPCGEASCVVLEAVLQPESGNVDEARDGLHKMAAAMGLPETAVGEVEVVDRVRVVLEPDGMRLHRSELTRTVRCTVAREGEKAEPLVIEELRTQDWTWL